MNNKKSDSLSRNKNNEKIQVIVRCRPLSKKDVLKNELSIVECNETEKSIKISLPNENFKEFEFDKVFGAGVSQKAFYNDAISPIVDEALKGYNCTILLYGQKGSGKTYTFEGPNNHDSSSCITSDCGLVFRSIHQIFEYLEQKKTDHFIRVSHLEIYNENLRDLLKTSNSNLRLYKDEKKNICVYNLTTVRINNPQDIYKILEKSREERKLSESSINPSRAHYIFSLVIHIKEESNDGECCVKVGKINFVEIGDSDCRSDKSNSRKQEVGNINKGLITFGRVINSLIESSPHVPYRESKLTQLLQDSLGGKTKTCIIATIKTSESSREATLNTLEFAIKAKGVKNKPELNQYLPQEELIREYQEEISSLQSQLESLKRKDGVYLSQERYEEIQEEINKYKSESSLLEERIEAKEKELKELIDILETNSKDIEMKETILSNIHEKIETIENELIDLHNQLDINNSKLQELKLLLNEHQLAEEKAQNEFQTVLNTLKTTMDDINKLMRKIESKDELEHSNINSFDSLKEQLSSQLDKTDNMLREYMEDSSEYHLNMKSDITLFYEEKSNLHHEFMKIMTSVEEDSTSHYNRLKYEYNANENSITQIFNQIKKKQLALINEDVKIQDSFSQQSAQLMEFLSQAVDSSFNLLYTWQDHSQKQLMNSLNSISSFSSQQRSNIHNIEETIGRFVKNQNDKNTLQNEILEAFLKSRLEDLSLFRESTINFITDVLNEFDVQYMENIQKQIGMIYDKLEHCMNENLFSPSNEFDFMIKETSDFLLSMNHLNEINAFECIVKSCNNNVHEKLNSLSTLSESINEFTHKKEILTKSNLIKTEEEFNKLSLEETNSMCSNTLNELRDNIKQMNAEFSESLLNYKNELRMYKEGFEYDFESCSQNMSNSSKAPISQIDLSKEKIKTFKLTQCGNTGHTPIKQHFEYPNILSNFRRENKSEEQRLKKDILNRRDALREITNDLSCK